MWDVFDHKHIHVFGQLLLGIYDDYGIDYERKKNLILRNMPIIPMLFWIFMTLQLEL